MSEQSFPASDPPATTPPPGSRRAERQQGERHQGEAEADPAGEAQPKGHPTSDRYHQETTGARQHGVSPPESDHRKSGQHGDK